MKKFITPQLIIALLTVAILWGNFMRIDEIRYDDWRSNNIDGYQFQKAPEYFKHLENRKITLFALQEFLILASGLVVIMGLKRNE
ncbi:MAG TPA: hypothetical protein VJB41_01095 [Patescibacteria group bacterium]|nr:hypothetical protein [Patescibacteria group bacterium]